MYRNFASKVHVLLKAYVPAQHLKKEGCIICVFRGLRFHLFVCGVWCFFYSFRADSFKTHTDTRAKQLWGLISLTFGSRLFDRPSQQARGHHVAAVDPLGLKYADLHAAFSNRKGSPSELVVRNYMLGKGSPLGKASVRISPFLFD